MLLAVEGTLRCPKPSGSLAGQSLGPLSLGMLRARARTVLRDFTVIAFHSDSFCLFGGWGIRALRGVRPGMHVNAVARTLGPGKPFHVGPNYWYVVSDGAVSGVLKARGGAIQEVGIANPALLGAAPGLATGDRDKQVRLAASS